MCRAVVFLQKVSSNCVSSNRNSSSSPPLKNRHRKHRGPNPSIILFWTNIWRNIFRRNSHVPYFLYHCIPVFYSTDELTDDFLPRRRHSLDHVSSDCKSLYWDSSSSSSSSSESDESEFYSPCQAYFQTRYVIGTNKPTKKVMDFFPSENGKYRYVSWFVIVYHGLFLIKILKIQMFYFEGVFYNCNCKTKAPYFAAILGPLLEDTMFLFKSIKSSLIKMVQPIFAPVLKLIWTVWSLNNWSNYGVKVYFFNLHANH